MATRVGGKEVLGQESGGNVKNLGVEVYVRFFKWRRGGGGGVFSMLGGKKYCGNKDALWLKWCGIGGKYKNRYM